MTRFLYKQSKMKTNTTQKPKMDAQNERHQKACMNLGARKELSLIVFRGYNILTHVVDGTTDSEMHG
jgi:hypothetical protein